MFTEAMAVLSILAASSPAAAPAATEGCRLQAQSEVDVIVFEDAKETSDAGNLLTSFKLKAAETSPQILTPKNAIRYKVRDGNGGAWRWGGKTACTNGVVVKI